MKTHKNHLRLLILLLLVLLACVGYMTVGVRLLGSGQRVHHRGRRRVFPVSAAHPEKGITPCL